MQKVDSKDIKSSLQNSFSTRADSFKSRSTSSETYRTISIKENETKHAQRQGSILQVIPEFIETDKFSSEGRITLKCDTKRSSYISQSSRFNNAEQFSISSSKDESSYSNDKCFLYPERNNEQETIPAWTQSSYYIQDLPEKFDGSSTKLNGTFVIGIKDQQNLQQIKRQHNKLLVTLVKNVQIFYDQQFIPVIFMYDIEKYKLWNVIPIILDYLDPPIHYPKQQNKTHDDLLCFSSFSMNNQIDHHPTKLKKNISQSFTLSDFTMLHEVVSISHKSRQNIKLQRKKIRSNTFFNEKKSIEKVDKERNSLLSRFNLDPIIRILQPKLSDSSINQDKPLILKKQQITVEKSEKESVIFKECCKQNFQACKHITRIAYITLEELNDVVLTSNYRHFYLVLIQTYQKLYQTNTIFVETIINYYYKYRKNKRIQKSIVNFLINLTDFRSDDLINDDEAIVRILNQFIDLSILMNFRVSRKLHQLLQILQTQVASINVQKKKRQQLALEAYNKQLSLITSSRRHKSMNFNDFKVISKQTSGRQDKFVLNSDLETLLKQGFSQDHWAIYLDVPTSVLQKQLWLIDFKLISAIKMSDFDISSHSITQSESSRSALKNLSIHFNMLVYHMIYSIITCPSRLLPNLFKKLIALSSLSIQAQHYQLVFLLHTALTHDITQSFLNIQVHLSLPSQLEFKNMIEFVQNKANILKSQSIEIENNLYQLPCIVWLQTELYKSDLQGSYMTIKEGIRFANFQKLEVIAQLLNPILQVKFKVSKIYDEELIKHINQPYYDFFLDQFKHQLKFNLNFEVENKIEIELYKLRNKMRQRQTMQK